MKESTKSLLIFTLGLTTREDAYGKYKEVEGDCKKAFRMELVICIILLLIKFVIIKRFIG